MPFSYPCWQPHQGIEKDILARNFTLLVEYYYVACNLPVGIYDPHLYYLGNNKTFLGLKGSCQCWSYKIWLSSPSVLIWLMGTKQKCFTWSVICYPIMCICVYNFIYFTCIDASSTCMSIHSVCASCPLRPEEDIGFPETGNVRCASTYWCSSLRSEPNFKNIK